MLPVVWLPIPLLLPILFGPSIAWIGRLVRLRHFLPRMSRLLVKVWALFWLSFGLDSLAQTSICRELQLDGTGVACPFRFFEFSLAWPSLRLEAWLSPLCGNCTQLQVVTEHCSAVLQMLSVRI